jgi:hypothetical protein
VAPEGADKTSENDIYSGGEEGRSCLRVRREIKVEEEASTKDQCADLHQERIIFVGTVMRPGSARPPN